MQQTDYERIATAIEYIRTHFKEQPDLDAVAAHVHMSPFHFQRMFTHWAGISPKKFLQFTSIEYAKQLLTENPLTLLDTAIATGLSGTGRLHDLFVSIEGMTPGEFKNGGASLSIIYDFATTPFGEVILANTPKGICHLMFTDNRETGLKQLISKFPNATFKQSPHSFHKAALSVFESTDEQSDPLRLHLKGTAFQLKVWNALLKIPEGQITSYGKLAGFIQHPRASRAVGTAIGENPVAFIIPCHRVLQSGGDIGGYRWGTLRKSLIIAKEASHKANRS